MTKGIRLCGIPHHRDISHSLGMYLERTYKKADDFKLHVKHMTEVKFKHTMKKVAYLLPPSQRTIARFINLSDWVKWSVNMLNIYHTLSVEEKSVFSFIPANAWLIEELSEVMCWIESIEHICKYQGLSKRSIRRCQAQIKKSLSTASERMIKLAYQILIFLDKEADLLASDQEVRNNSSDIVESLFGIYKRRKSPNKLYGVTPFILFIPVHTQLINATNAKHFHFKECLERIQLKDIEEWAAENLSPNLVTKRNKTLKIAG